jgi:hypothetical protein
LREKNNV